VDQNAKLQARAGLRCSN